MYLYGLHEAGKIPTVERHEHEWEFVKFRWETNLTYKAYAIFECSVCGEEREVQATVTKLFKDYYQAAVRADESPDGEAHVECRRGIVPSVWNKKKSINPINPNPQPISPRLP